MDFYHSAPNCYLLLPAEGKDTTGAYFKATCTACPDRGMRCDASDGWCAPKEHEGKYIMYDETRAELECLVLAMNGSKLLNEWKADRRCRHDSDQ